MCSIKNRGPQRIAPIVSAMVFLLAVFTSLEASAQKYFYLDSISNGTVIDVNREFDEFGVSLTSDGSEVKPYSKGDYRITFKNTETCVQNSAFGFKLTLAALSPNDELLVYDGSSTSSSVLCRVVNDTIYIHGQTLPTSDLMLNDLTIYVSDTNSCDCFTVRLNAVTGGTAERQYGFRGEVSCYRICERVVPVIEPVFYKTRGGEVYDRKVFSDLYIVDTVFELVYDSVLNDSVYSDNILSIDTVGAMSGVYICMGDGLKLCAHGNYTSYSGRYTPRDESSIFTWQWGNGARTADTGLTCPLYEGYNDVQCYDITLSMTDTLGCNSTIPATVQVRIAPNPIKTLFTLATTCNTDSLQVNIGYDGDNATMTLKQIEYSRTVSKVNPIRVFIPDGKCVQADGSESQCYEAPVEFKEFPAGRKVMSGSDICSICINYEHSFMGDYRISIVCPSGQEAIIKYANAGHDPDLSGGGSWVLVTDGQGGYSPVNISGTAPPGSISLSHSGIYTGMPAGGSNDSGYDNTGTETKCDSTLNPYGIGFDYCFSRNADYTLVTGKSANTTDPQLEDFVFCGSAYLDTVNMVMPPIPGGFYKEGETVVVENVTTKKQSNYEERSDYYLPVSDFSSLIGCPLNGTWSIKLCDYWGIDNGWVFNWSMDICKLNNNSSCEYQVGIDSVVWFPDPDERYHDYDMGHYRGLVVHKRDESRSFLLSPDTAGTFPIIVRVYDEFGCIWDTVTKITTVWTPTPSLGNDTLLCSIESIVLDASDRHAATNNYSYVWEPNGQTTDTIHTDRGIVGERYYIAEVVNKQHSVRCSARDTCLVRVNRQPVPNFDPGVYPLEGCEPFTVNFNNTSTDGHHYLWVFGDGITSTEESPVHIYGEGTFDFKYYIYSVDGCVDSLIFPELVTVFPNPKTSFSWTPTYPTVLNPNVQFINQTVPDWESNRYYWEIQYNRTHPLSVQTETDKNPYFNWYSTNDDDLPGTYIARLIARTDNYGPSGNLVHCFDTTENTILLVNDFLQFPNVVTPNGDGVNDRFIIKNLVDGLGYPINQLDIYNKWGAHVFHKDNIATEDDFWDPNVGNMPTGTYFYRFSARGYNGNIERNGVIEVIR